MIIDRTPNYSYSIGVFDLFGVMACLAILCALSIHIPSDRYSASYHRPFGYNRPGRKYSRGVCIGLGLYAS